MVIALLRSCKGEAMPYIIASYFVELSTPPCSTLWRCMMLSRSVSRFHAHYTSFEHAIEFVYNGGHRVCIHCMAAHTSDRGKVPRASKIVGLLHMERGYVQDE